MLIYYAAVALVGLILVAVALAAALVALIRHVRLTARRLRSVIVPLALLGPSRTPLVAPVWRRLALPLFPVPRRHVVVPHWHRQHGSRNELRRDKDPGAVVTAAHMPARRREHPVLSAVEEDVPWRLRRVTHGGNARDHHEGWRRR